jgi:hypothetical protein
VAGVAAVACHLATITSLDGALSTPLRTGTGPLPLPVGSIVRAGAETCEDGVGIEVLGMDDSLPVTTTVSVGTRGCVAEAALARPGHRVLRVVHDAGGLGAGSTSSPIEETIACDAQTFIVAGKPRPLAILAGARFMEAADQRALLGVQAVYAGLFGPSAVPAPLAVPMNPFGRIALPLSLLSDAQIAAEIDREHLVTPAQREKVTVALGPLRATPVGDVPVYDHFLGADAPGTDTWALPSTIAAFVTLASGWFDACAATMDPRLCTLHVGDLAYVDGRRPDPLGHKDHFSGTCVDLRLFRSDLSRYEAWWNRPDDRTGASVYDAGRTITFLRYAYAHAALGDVFFDDPAVVAAVPGVRVWPGHDDHVHLCFVTDTSR